jgi:hypothetical protein
VLKLHVAQFVRDRESPPANVLYGRVHSDNCRPDSKGVNQPRISTTKTVFDDNRAASPGDVLD